MISVIIPTYKSPEYLDLCLQSAVEGQENKNQIIVVVDGHYDVNEHVLNKWCHTIEILNLEENVGLCKGTNLGVMNAKHDKVLIVNDDNVFPKDWDLILEDEWEEGAVISPNQVEPYPSMFNQFIIEDLGKTIDEFNLNVFWKSDQSKIHDIKKDETGSTLPIFMSKLDYLKIGGWDENYELGMVADWDFFLKCQLNGLRMLRTYNCHFYHFASASTNGEARHKAEKAGHEYAKYKWGMHIQHNSKTNKKFIH
jgi:O-antigen biosynthesis protein|tara:strand:- start:44 stop:802 length:759 start_codon:yes stop_codon:yes gene_type:complete